ncbi:hypothetical protein BD413DRAFT_241641 [Trametes elegans]|nr:hypothetical protein BD413DRAFT_241641 [Trametes elegans]
MVPLFIPFAFGVIYAFVNCLCWIYVLRSHDVHVCPIVHVPIWCLSARLRPPLPAISSPMNSKWGPKMSRHVYSLASSSTFRCHPRPHLCPRPRPCLSCSRIYLTFRRLRGAQCSVTAIPNYRSPPNSAVDQTTDGAQSNPTQYALHGEVLDCLQALSGLSTVCLPDPRQQNTSRSQCHCPPRPSPPMSCATAIDLPPSSLFVTTPVVFHSQGLAHIVGAPLSRSPRMGSAR